MPKKRIQTLAEEHKVDIQYLIELIESKLPEETVTGTGNARWVNEEGQRLLEGAVDIPELSPKIYKGKVLHPAQNRSYIYAYIKEIKKKVPVAIPRRLERFLTPRKEINIEAIVDNKGTSYRYVK